MTRITIRKTLAATLTAVALAGGGILQATPAQAASVNPACQFIFLVPHQDDELLTMGAGILEHTRTAAGASATCVVMMTTGTNSGVKTALRNPALNPDGKAHYLSDAQFQRARDLETWNALLYLGVPRSNIYLNGFGQGGETGVPRFVDTNDGSEAQRTRIRQWTADTIRAFGKAHYKTMTNQSADRQDHHALGQALRDQWGPVENSTPINPNLLSVRFYKEPYLSSSVATGRIGWTSTSEKLKLQMANKSFRRWDPANGYYSIGYKSVKALFDQHYVSPYSYQHK